MFGSKRKLGALDLRLGGFFSELTFGYDLAVELLEQQRRTETADQRADLNGAAVDVGGRRQSVDDGGIVQGEISVRCFDNEI